MCVVCYSGVCKLCDTCQVVAFAYQTVDSVIVIGLFRPYTRCKPTMRCYYDNSNVDNDNGHDNTSTTYSNSTNNNYTTTNHTTKTSNNDNDITTTNNNNKKNNDTTNNDNDTNENSNTNNSNTDNDSGPPGASRPRGALHADPDSML